MWTRRSAMGMGLAFGASLALPIRAFAATDALTLALKRSGYVVQKQAGATA